MISKLNLDAKMPHVDAAYHTRGESQYVDDAPAPAGMLHAAIYGSPVAHGTLHSVDYSRARALPGVIGIFSAADLIGENQIGPIIADEPLLADGEVHYQGQPIAVIAATSAHIARKAVMLIQANITPKRVIVDPREAFAEGELIAPPRTFTLGDVEGAWEQCAHIVSGQVEIAGQEHLYLETQRARAIPLEGDRLWISASTQSPYAAQKTVAKVLGIAQHMVEVDVKRLGGGFGGKEDQATPWACLAALPAYLLRRPVELVLPRLDDLKMTGKRHPYSADYTIGLSQDGKILAYDVKLYQNSGACADLSTAVLERSLFHATNAYYIPNARIFAACCRTNLHPHTAFRGFGGPQSMFVIESAITHAAEAMGKPREHIQRANLIREGELFTYRQRCEQDLAATTWDVALDHFGFDAMRAEADAFNASHTDKKRGLAIMPICFGISFTKTFFNQAGALMHVYTDGSVSLSTGGVEMGQGVSTKMADLAAEALGIRRALIHVEATNTTRVANMSPSAASATADLNGHATLQAIAQLMGRLRPLAAKLLALEDPSRITVRDEQVCVDGAPSEMSWEQLIAKAYHERVDLSAHGFYATPDLWFDAEIEQGRPFAYHVYGAAIVGVTVDTVRGIYDIDTVRVVHDLGRPINPLIDLGQIEGGLAQGLGWMTLEELAYNSDGRMTSHALSTYKAPDVFFMPDDLQVHFLQQPGPQAPRGSKAVGEPPLMYGIGVYFALHDAVRAYDQDAPLPFHAPMTPERVLMSLHHKRIGRTARPNANPTLPSQPSPAAEAPRKAQP